MIYKEVSEYDFIDTFNSSETYKNNFSYDGLMALYNYIKEYYDDIGENYEFDMVALCCEYTEYDNIDEIIENYTSTFDENVSKEQALVELQNYTQVIEVENGHIIIQNF